MVNQQATIRLLVEGGPGGAREVSLDTDEVVIGRDIDCDVVLYAPYVSRRHAILRRSDTNVVVSDRESKNGVYVNDRRITESTCLSIGDIVSIGAFRLTVLGPSGREPTTQEYQARQPSIVIDHSSRTVLVDGLPPPAPLSAQEFALVALLYERANTVVTREEIGNAVWGQGNFDFNMIHRLMRRVRLKVEPDPARPRLIENAPRFGYILKRAVKS